jgi:CubicO group peptidase (beta-lactamase class C family)
MKTSQLVAWIASCSVLLAVGCDSSTQESDIPVRFQPFARAVEQERVALGAPGMAVAVVERGEVTFAHGFGVKDARGGDPVKPTTLFRIGSCTKMLTAVALLQAAQDGLVDLADPVTKPVPAFHLNQTPDAVAGITLRHLLTHTSGMSDFGEDSAPVGEQTDAGLETFLTGRFADIGYVASPPGAVWAYANPNFMLAGLVVEKVRATPYRIVMHDRVFAPLGMERTYFLPAEVLADGDYAVGANCTTANDPRCAAPNPPASIEPDSYDNPGERPAGFAWSSVLDLAKVARFLVHGQDDLLRSDLWAAMTSAQAPTKELGDLESYGFGVFVSDGLGGSPQFPYRALKTVGHGGDIPGFAADIVCVPPLDACVVALASGTGAHLSNSLAVALQTLTNLPPPSAMPDVAPKPDRYPLYAGTYNDPFVVGRVTVTTDGKKLYIQLPFLDASNTPYTQELQPLTVDNFLLTAGGQQQPLTFIADANGVYAYIRSRPYLAVRTSVP